MQFDLNRSARKVLRSFPDRRPVPPVRLPNSGSPNSPTPILLVFPALALMLCLVSCGSGSGQRTQPPALTYATTNAVYTKGAAITPDAPTNSGGAATSYSVAPALPAGLSLNATTGVISGTPTA